MPRVPPRAERRLAFHGRCGDCGVVTGALHHPGCDVDGRLLEDSEDDLEDDLDVDLDLDRALRELLCDAPVDRSPFPLESVVPPLRLRHQPWIQRLTTVAGASGVDDLSVLAVAALGPHRGPDGTLHLRRPDVVAAVHRARFLLEDHAVAPTAHLPAAVAHVIRLEAEVGGLGDRADPLDALLEPLHAHFGVGPGVTDHLCQCFAPHDPWLPADHRLLPLRCGWTVHARIPDPFDRAPAEAALRRFTESAGAPPADEDRSVGLDLLGLVYGPHRIGRLWAFGDDARPGRYDALYLSDEGTAHVARPDRRCSGGYRWAPVPHEATALSRLADRGRFPVAVA